MSTFSAKPAEVDKKWVMIDAEGLSSAGSFDRGDAATRQAQAQLHAPRGLRRQRHHHQRRQGGADRPQGRAEGLSEAHRLYRRHQGAFGEVDPGRSLSGAHRREGGRADVAARSVGTAPTRQLAGLSARRDPHAAQQPEQIDIAAMNRKNKRVA